jgi:hypothetical protein
MSLEKSRKALRLAEKYLTILEELANDDDPEAFKDSFVGAIAVIRSVGNAVQTETKSLGRTFQFAQWWKQSESDPRYQCVKDTRDLVLKEAGEAAQVHHEVLVTDVAMANATAYDAAVTTGTSRIDVTTNEGKTETDTFSSAPEPSAATYRRTWVFANGRCAGQELLPVLREFLEWMSNDVIPRAEQGSGEASSPGLGRSG